LCDQGDILPGGDEVSEEMYLEAKIELNNEIYLEAEIE
jgi:hypothetical protein